MKDGFAVDCRVQVYPLAFEDFAKKYKEKGQRKREWFRFDTAAGKVNEPMLRQIILNFGRTLTPSPA